MDLLLMKKEDIKTKKMFFYLIFTNPAEDGIHRFAAKYGMQIDFYCRHCNKQVFPEDAAIIVGYWKDIWFISHEACAKPGKLQEAYECQNIDADCNDCGYFQRGPHNKRLSNEFFLDPVLYKIFTGDEQSDIKEQKRYMQDLFFIGSYDGICSKTSRSVSAWPGQFTGRSCFVHRKDMISGQEKSI